MAKRHGRLCGWDLLYQKNLKGQPLSGLTPSSNLWRLILPTQAWVPPLQTQHLSTTLVLP